MLSTDHLKIASHYLLAFILGFLGCYVFYPRTITITEHPDNIIQGTTQTVTKTELVYVPKSSVTQSDGSITREITDLELKIPLQELNVKINGRDAVIHKTSDEQYVFEKNKVQLAQTSRAEINIAVPTVDNTRRWSVGLGYGNNGLAGTLGFPLYKSSVDGWVYADKQTRTAGIKFRF